MPSPVHVGYNDAAAAYFPYTQPSTRVLSPEQTAVLQILKASEEALRRQLASKLLDLVFMPQSKVVATFLLAYFYECLGLTAVDTNQGLLLSTLMLCVIPGMGLCIANASISCMCT